MRQWAHLDLRLDNFNISLSCVKAQLQCQMRHRARTESSLKYSLNWRESTFS